MHDLSQYSDSGILIRIVELMDPNAFPIECECDDFEVDDGYVTRKCPWNDVVALERELERREAGK